MFKSFICVLGQHTCLICVIKFVSLWFVPTYTSYLSVFFCQLKLNLSKLWIGMNLIVNMRLLEYFRLLPIFWGQWCSNGMNMLVCCREMWKKLKLAVFRWGLALSLIWFVIYTPCQMPSTRWCRCCTWWQWFACCRARRCFSQGHKAMAMPLEFLKVLQVLKC
jgi:hypothetical protein